MNLMVPWTARGREYGSIVFVSDVLPDEREKKEKNCPLECYK